MKKMDTKMLHISEVRVAERIRKDNGGLEELANDIHEHGLINPRSWSSQRADMCLSPGCGA